MPKDVHSPHDRFFNSTFKNKETAARFIEAYVPKDIVNCLDLNGLEADNTHFVDESLQHYRSDLLYQIPLKNGQPSYLYLLFEHQSTPDASMPFRLLQYMVKIWEYTRDKHNTQRLLPILPLVLSQSHWPYSPTFSQMMECSEEERKLFKPWMPDFNHLLVDLSKLNEGEIEGNVYGKIALHLLKSSQKGCIIDAYQCIEPLVSALLQQDSTLGFIETLLRYSAQVAEDVETLDELRELVVNTIDEKAGDTLMTIAEQIERKVADKYEHQLNELTRESQQALEAKDHALEAKDHALEAKDHALEAKEREKSIALQEKEELLRQLREAGIEPKIKH